MTDTDKAEEKQVAPTKGKSKKPARKENASSVHEETLPKPGPAALDGVIEIPHRPDTAPAEIGSLPGDRYPTPKPEGMHRSKSSRRRERKRQQEAREVAKLQQLSVPPPDDVDSELDGAKAASSKISANGPDLPTDEIIDLTIKEESRSATPIPPARGPELNEGPAGLKAGWVRCSGGLNLGAF